MGARRREEVMARKEKTRTLAVDDEGNWWIPLRESGISALCAFIDGLQMASFGRSSKLYLRLETGLKWFKDELPHARRQEDIDRYNKAIEIYEGLITRAAAGQIPIEPKTPARRARRLDG
jgi:hypothetical protein